MISPQYAKLILNAMFNIKEAEEEVDPKAQQAAELAMIQEMASAVNISNLKDQVENIPVASYLSEEVYINQTDPDIVGGVEKFYGIPADAYKEVWENNGYKSTSELQTAFDKLKENIEKKIKKGEIIWYTLSSTSTWTYYAYLKDTNKDEKIDEDDKPTHTYNVKGWYIKLRKDGAVHNYPTDAFLGLYIDPVGSETAGSGMPGPDGTGGMEVDPDVVNTDSGEALQYTRVNLHRDIVMGEDSLSVAATGDNGETILKNANEILFPEILSQDSELGSFSGFGVYSSSNGASPIIWGRIKDEEGNPVTVKAKQYHVPLFKKEDFKLILK